jgi:cellulose biosynthesis protein BcsQ
LIVTGKVISVVNMKGGVGKTTTVVCLSETLAAAQGKSVLVIDIDTQANASYCLAGDKILSELIKNDRTIDEFLHKRLVDNIPCPINEFVRPNISHVTHLGEQLNVSLLASSPYLRVTEREIIYNLTKRRYSMEAVEGRTTEALKSPIEGFRKNYDFIIFDCAPGISAFTTAAISHSDLVIIPTIPDFLSVLGLSAFSEQVLRDVQRHGGNCKAYVLITRKNNTNQQNEYHRLIQERASKTDPPFSLFDTVVPEAASIPASLRMIDDQHPTYGQKYGPNIAGVLSSLATEVMGVLK